MKPIAAGVNYILSASASFSLVSSERNPVHVL